MTIVFPAWYEGGYEDVEKVIVQLLKPHLAACTPAIKTFTFLPKDIVTVNEPGVWVNRMPTAPLEKDKPVDWAIIQTRVLSPSRQDSWDLNEFVRQLFKSYRRGGDVRMADSSLASVHSIEEVVTGTEHNDALYDWRLIPASYRVALRLPRGLPDYAATRPRF